MSRLLARLLRELCKRIERESGAKLPTGRLPPEWFEE
jgi:hypothetical protein